MVVRTRDDVVKDYAIWLDDVLRGNLWTPNQEEVCAACDHPVVRDESDIGYSYCEVADDCREFDSLYADYMLNCAEISKIARKWAEELYERFHGLFM